MGPRQGLSRVMLEVAGLEITRASWLSQAFVCRDCSQGFAGVCRDYFG